jgi:putative addiction module killer protein
VDLETQQTAGGQALGEGLDAALPSVSFGIQWAVIEVRQTDRFAHWFDRLRDRRGRARILVRIRRLSLGNPGDVRAVGEGVFELRIDSGPGYRIYFARRGLSAVVLLAGGDKRTQRNDIRRAVQLARRV